MDISTNNAVPELVPTFRLQWEKAQDCYVLLYPEGMIKLSQSAGEIMKRVDGNQSVGQIIDDLESRFPGAELEDDVRKFLEVANDNGWIRVKSE